jgi:hypothetical protein
LISESSSAARHDQSGNAMIYILIALVLIGALTMILSRQNQRASGENMTEEMLNFETTRMKSYATGAQDSVNKMLMSGSNPDDLDFSLPNAASFETGTNIHKVYHPEGGGLNPGVVDPKIFTGTDNNPAPGWYMGRFNNIGWSASGAQDVVLVAHQIDEAVCARLNKDLTGSAVIPALGGTGNIRDYLIDDSLHSGANANLTAAECAACENKVALCVSNTAANMWSYFVVIESR